MNGYRRNKQTIPDTNARSTANPAGLPLAPSGLTAWKSESEGAKVLIFSYDFDQSALAALTLAERWIVLRALDGSTNAQIADARGTSTRTVANLLARAYRKLHVSSRRELASLLCL